MRSLKLAVLAILVPASLIACSPLKPSRTLTSACDVRPNSKQLAGRECADHSVEKHAQFSATYVELTDMGLFHQRAQLDAALKLVAADPGDLRHTNILVFVHGWKHSANHDDPDVSAFTETVMPTVAASRPDAKTIGIYVGWRGSPLKVIKEITFYDRKSAADHIARGSLRELLSNLRAIKQQQGDKVTITLVGHSFGGLILFNAIGGAIMDSLVQANYAPLGTETVAPSLYDAAVLLNPAFEAVRFEPLFQAGKFRAKNTLKGEGWPASQRPLLVSITSESDSATRDWFPVGRMVNSWFQSEATIDQDDPQASPGFRVEKLANTKTMGHMPRYKTHRLSLTSGRVTCSRAENNLLDDGSHFPLWTMLADQQVIRDHNAIYDPHLWHFISSLASQGRNGVSCSK